MEQSDFSRLQTSYQETVYTSTAYRLNRQDWTDEKNISVFGTEASDQGTGCNFQLDVKINRQMNHSEKAVWSKKVKEISLLIDHKHLNQDLPEFSNKVPSLENVARYIFDKLKVTSDDPLQIRLWEGPRRWVELDNQSMKYGQSCKISCVHKHWNPDLSSEENKQIYTKCSGLHGHEYRIDVTVSGVPDAESGWIISRDEMTKILNDKIVSRFHGQYLNDLIGNTSGEKIALQFFSLLKDQFLTRSLYRVTVSETRKNSFFAGASPF